MTHVFDLSCTPFANAQIQCTYAQSSGGPSHVRKQRKGGVLNNNDKSHAKGCPRKTSKRTYSRPKGVKALNKKGRD